MWVLGELALGFKGSLSRDHPSHGTVRSLFKRLRARPFCFKSGGDLLRQQMLAPEVDGKENAFLRQVFTDVASGFPELFHKYKTGHERLSIAAAEHPTVVDDLCHLLRDVVFDSNPAEYANFPPPETDTSRRVPGARK